jgi:hypothetical protein
MDGLHISKNLPFEMKCASLTSLIYVPLFNND